MLLVCVETAVFGDELACLVGRLDHGEVDPLESFRPGRVFARDVEC